MKRLILSAISLALAIGIGTAQEPTVKTASSAARTAKAAAVQELIKLIRENKPKLDYFSIDRRCPRCFHAGFTIEGQHLGLDYTTAIFVDNDPQPKLAITEFPSPDDGNAMIPIVIDINSDGIADRGSTSTHDGRFKRDLSQEESQKFLDSALERIHTYLTKKKTTARSARKKN